MQIAAQIKKRFPFIIGLWRAVFRQLHWPIGEYGRSIWLQREFERFIQPEDQLVLNAGCGQGANTISLAQLYPQLTFVGVDIDKDVIQVANDLRLDQSVSNVSFYVGSLQSLSLKDAFFSKIIIFEVLTVVEDDQMTMANLAGSLKSGGHLIIHVSASDHTHFLGPLSPTRFPGRVRYGYTPHSLTKLLEEHGFEVEMVRHTFGIFAGTAWELWHILGYHPLLWPLRFILRPLYLVAVWVDLRRNCEKGRGLLCVAKRK